VKELQVEKLVKRYPGREQVVAVDVGRDQLRPEFRSDPRVVVFEGLDIARVSPAVLGGPFDLVVADLFIPLGARPGGAGGVHRGTAPAGCTVL
jgi:23S rRNA (cytidine1920-2'-O)/16S rRNA (cytidine1409-2'-O)-methyltransferase